MPENAPRIINLQKALTKIGSFAPIQVIDKGGDKRVGNILGACSGFHLCTTEYNSVATNKRLPYTKFN